MKQKVSEKKIYQNQEEFICLKQEPSMDTVKQVV